MVEIIDSMLDVSRIDTNQLELLPADMEIQPVIEKVNNVFQSAFQERNISLTTAGLTDLPVLCADKDQLYKVFYHVIGNAIKYTPDGGTVTLSSRNEAGMVSIFIRDTGYGIPASDLPHLFERFYRVRNNGHDEIEGNGLGLAIVRSSARQHGGDVTVESEPGKGSCFTVALPLADEK